MSDARIAARLKRLRPTAVNRILHEVRDLEAQGKSLVSLMRGQPDSPTAAHIVEAAFTALRMGRTGYPDNRGELALRKAVAEKLKRVNGLVYDPATEILITDGATQGLFTALGALVRPDDDVLLTDPIYDAYDGAVFLWGGRPVRAAGAIRAGRFTVDRPALEATCTPRTTVLLVNTPWNPVGTVLTRAELQDAMEFAASHDLVVVSDEIYEALVYGGAQHTSSAAISKDARQRTVVINSLSKTYSMTGWRVGYCAGPAALIEAMLLVLQQFSRGPATFVQDAAACALSADQIAVTQMVKEYEARRDWAVSRLTGIPGVLPLVPEGGLFVMVDVRGLGRPSDEVRRFLLHEAGVVVMHGAAYGPGGEGTLRVSFAAGGAILEQGLGRLREGLLGLAQQRPGVAQ
jgi:aspartate/methionine/tyrosine aminotransferase